MLLTKCRFIWPSGFRGEDFLKSANQIQELFVAIVSNDVKHNISSLTLFSSSCQRQCELLPSLGVRRPLTFHLLIFYSETPLPNERVAQ
jgi:hypothetical protein